MNPRLARLAAATAGRRPRIGLLSMYDIENNAVRLLAAVLRQEGLDPLEIYFKDWVSNTLLPPTDAELDGLVDLVRRERLDLLGISLRASAYFQTARTLTDRLHEALDLPVLWGGMHPTLEPEACLRHADLVIRGEGEVALRDLCRRLARGEPIEDLPNLGLVGPGGQARLNPLGPLVEDLDALPYRDYTSHHRKVLLLGRRPRWGDPMHGDPVFQMMGSRGCIYRCAFCYNSTFKKRVYPGQRWFRTRSPESVVEEIARARTHWPFRRVRFDDEVFNPQRRWLEAFARLYPREVGLPFEIFIEPKLVDPERMRLLRQVGLEGVYMGVQSSERVTGHLYDRRVRNQAIVEITRLFHKLGIKPHLQLIFDDPVATEDDFATLFDLVASFPHPFDLYLFSMTVFPGSELNQKLLEGGIISEYDVEGINTRVFYQHRVNLQYPRPVEQTFWIALIQMLSKPFVPRAPLRALSRSSFLRRHPWPLIQAAHAANAVKMAGMVGRMVAEGEMTRTLWRRWASAERIITT